jgi:hypothetical protein
VSLLITYRLTHRFIQIHIWNVVKEWDVCIYVYTDQEAPQQYSVATLVIMTESTTNYTGIGAFHICQVCTIIVNYE